MKCIYCSLLVATLVPLRSMAKECYAFSGLIFIHAGGETDTLLHPYSTSYFLDEGDQAKLTYRIDGYCMFGYSGLVIKRDGTVIYDGFASTGSEFDVSEPGFYEVMCYADNYFGPEAFFIAHGQVSLVQVDVKAWLQGPYDPETGLMHDDLRTTGVLPFFYGMDSTAMVVNGPNALVDQVWVELRLANSPHTRCESRIGLLQRDGDIVAMDSTSTLSFGAPAGDYYVVVSHRNHLRAMTADPIALDSTPVTLDFRDPNFPTYGTDARKIQGNAALLWAGKVSGNSISYTGSLNDRDVILQVVGSLPYNSVIQYSKADLNMDGMVKYTGSNNDRDALLVYLGGSVPTFVRQEQVP